MATNRDGFELVSQPATNEDGFEIVPAAPVNADGFEIAEAAPDTLLQQAGYVGSALVTGIKSALRNADLAAEALAGPNVPTARQRRRAFEQSMADPSRLRPSIDETGGFSFGPESPGMRLAGPEAKLEAMRQPIETGRAARQFDIARASEELAQRPKSQTMKSWDAIPDNDLLGMAKAIATNPVEIIATIAAESLPASLAGLPAGPVGVGVSSGLSEFAGGVVEGAGRLGYDFRNPDDIAAFFRNSAAVEKVNKQAAEKAGVIGGMDALSAGMAGQLLGKALGKGTGKVLAASAGELGMQMAAGASGEALGSLASGQPVSGKAVLSEAIGELAGAPAETVSNLQENATVREVGDVPASIRTGPSPESKGGDRVEAQGQGQEEVLTPAPVDWRTVGLEEAPQADPARRAALQQVADELGLAGVSVRWKPGLTTPEGAPVQAWVDPVTGELAVNLADDAFATADTIRPILREEAAHLLLRSQEAQTLLQDFARQHLTTEAVLDLERHGYVRPAGLADQEWQSYIAGEFVAKAARENLPWWRDMVERARVLLAQASGGRLVSLTSEEAARALLRSVRKPRPQPAVTVETKPQPPAASGFVPTPQPDTATATTGEERRFVRQVDVSSDISDEVRQRIEPARFYTPRSNESDAQYAARIVSEAGGPEAAIAVWRNKASGLPGAVRGFLGQEILKGLGAAEQVAALTDPAESQRLGLVAADFFVNELAPATTDAGQFVQSLAAFGRLSPEGMVGVYRLTMDQAGAKARERFGVALERIREALAAVDAGTAIGPSGPKPQFSLGKKQSLADKRRRAILKAAESAPRQLRRKLPVERLIELANLGLLTEENVWNAVREKHGLPSFNLQTAAEIRRQAQAMQKLPEGFRKQAATQSIMQDIARQKGVSMWDLPMAFWYANTLSGPATHVVNLFSNATQTVAHAGFATIRRPSMGLVYLDALADGFNSGLVDAAHVLRIGQVTGTRVTRKADAGNPLEWLGDETWLKRLVGKWKYVHRAMAAADVVFYKTSEAQRTALLAAEVARTEGLHGQALAQRVREVVRGSEAQQDAAARQAASEGLDWLETEKRRREIIQQAQPDAMRQNAHDYAVQVIFNNQPYGALGKVASALKFLARQLPASRLVVPFVDVVANVTNESLNYFPPIGYGRALHARYTGSLNGRLTDLATEAGRQDFFDQYAKATVGTAAMLGVTLLAGEHLDEEDPWFAVFGAGPSDPNKRKLLRARGWMPWSYKIGNHYHSYAETPLAIALGVVGSYMDAVRWKKMDQADALDRAAIGVSGLTRVILDRSFLRGLNDFFTSLSRESAPGKASEAAVNTAARAVGGFVVPNALRWVDRVFDPRQTDTSTIQGALLNQVPFVRRLGRPALDSLGQPVIYNPTERFMRKATDDPLVRLLVDKKAWPSTPEQKELTGDEFYEMTRIRGELLRNKLNSMLPTLKQSSPERVRFVVERLGSAFSLRARKQVISRRESAPSSVQPQ